MPARIARSRSRRLVIDASIAGTVGGRETAQSRNCRVFLKSLRDICHRIVITPLIHRSGHNRRYSSGKSSR